MTKDNCLAPVGEEIGENVDTIEGGELGAEVDYIS